jgi:hypothetical protein
VRSTYLNDLQVWDMALDKADNIYIGGLGVSREFVLRNSLQTYLGGISNADNAVMMFACGGSYADLFDIDGRSTERTGRAASGCR